MSSEQRVRHFRWDEMPIEKVKEGLGRRLVTGDRMMLAHIYLDKGAVVPLHSHDNEQLTYVLEGALHFWFGEDESEEVIVRAGEVLHRKRFEPLERPLFPMDFHAGLVLP